MKPGPSNSWVRSLAQGFQRLVDRLGRGCEWRVALQRDPDTLAGEIIDRRSFPPARRRARSAAWSRRKLPPVPSVLDAGEEQRVDACGLVGLGARDVVGTVIDDAPVRPMMTSEGSLRPSSAAFILPTPSSSEISCVFACRSLRQQRILDRQPAGARRLQFLHGAADIERIAIAMIGIDQHRQTAARDIRRICSPSSVA